MQDKITKNRSKSSSKKPHRSPYDFAHCYILFQFKCPECLVTIKCLRNCKTCAHPGGLWYHWKRDHERYDTHYTTEQIKEFCRMMAFALYTEMIPPNSRISYSK